MNASTPKLSAVIVNYRTPELTKTCVESLRRWKIVADDEIIVVDNDSPDDSLARLRAELPGVKVMASGRNGGLSFGINAGARAASGDYLLMLNPDTCFVDDSIGQALCLLDEVPEIGLVGLGLVYPDGSDQYSARRFYSVLDIVARRSPLGRHWPLRGRMEKHLMIAERSRGEPFAADWVMGTGFIVRRELFWRIGGMDESYFLYMEDVDLCARVWQAGAKVVCIPQAKLVHHHQRASSSGPLGRAGRMHLKSLLTFARKHRLPLLVPPRAML